MADEYTERYLKVTDGTKGKRTSTSSSSTGFKINSTADGLHASAHFAISLRLRPVPGHKAMKPQRVFSKRGAGLLATKPRQQLPVQRQSQQ